MSDQATVSTVPAGNVAAPITRSWRTEDWIAVVLGFLVITTVLVLFQWKVFDLRNVVPTFRWTTDSQIASLTPGWTAALDQIERDAQSRQQQNVRGAEQEPAQRAGEPATARRSKRRLPRWRRSARARSPARWRRKSAATPPPRPNACSIAPISSRCSMSASAFWSSSAIGIALIGWRVAPFLIGLPVIFALAWFARFLAGNGVFVNWGIEYVIFALLLGLLISNTIGTPAWLKPAVQTEFFIKTGLVILGASLLFQEVLQAGALGIVQALLVVFVVWYACFWLARKLRVDDEFAAMLSTAVSICGVSAAIAACGAIKGDKKKLSYVTSLVLIVAVPMMIVMPWIAKATGMDDLVAGAWLGGTLDTSASVVAAGALISDAAMKTGVIVKFSQNALIGVAAFALAIWWALQDRRRDRRAAERGRDLGAVPEIRARLRRWPRRCSRSRCRRSWSPAPAARSARSAPGGSRSPSSASGSRPASSSLPPTSRAGRRSPSSARRAST